MTQKTDGKLEDIHIKENSGVDEPAHLTPGWIVMKQADGDFLDSRVAAIIEEAELMAKSYSELTEALAANEGFLTDAPTPVQAAAKLLSNYLRGMKDDAPDEEPDNDPDDYPPPNKKAKPKMDAEDAKEGPEGANDDAEDQKEGPEYGYGYPPANGKRPTKKEFVEFLLDGGALELYKSAEFEKSRISKKHLGALQETLKALDELYKSLTDAEETPVTKGAPVAEEMKEETPAAEAETETPSELEALTKSVNDIGESLTKLTETFTTALDELGTRVETVEAARGVRKSLDGQDENKDVQKSLWSNVIPRRVE